MSNCTVCFGRGTTIGPNGPQSCSNCGGGVGQVTEELFADWYRQYGRMVRRIAAARLQYQDRGLVDDIAQETWLQLWTCALRGADLTGRPIAGLLATITRHRVGMYYRRVAAYKRPTTRATDYTEPVSEGLNPSRSAEETAVARMVSRELIAALPTFVPKVREHAFTVAGIA